MFLQQGRFTEARQAAQETLKLLPSGHAHRQVVSELLQKCERFLALDGKLTSILQGDGQPHDAAERIALAQLCQGYKRRQATAVRFYAEAFVEQPTLAGDVDAGHRYNAACAAALAGCSQGKDAAELSDKERAGLRQQALGWLGADLDAWQALLGKGPDKAHAVIIKQMQHWQQDTDFAGVRGPEAVARLPEAERPAWQKLWADVADTLAAARRKAATEKSDPKLTSPKNKESPAKQ